MNNGLQVQFDNFTQPQGIAYAIYHRTPVFTSIEECIEAGLREIAVTNKYQPHQLGGFKTEAELLDIVTLHAPFRFESDQTTKFAIHSTAFDLDDSESVNETRSRVESNPNFKHWFNPK